MTTAINQTMHHDHVEWSSDCDMWRDDIRAWQLELETARKIVGRLTKALHAHEEMLRQHAGAIRLNEQVPDAHEHVLKHQEQGCPGRGIASTDAQHVREATKHAELKLAHEQIKRKHHATAVAWDRLLRTLDADDGSQLDADRIAQIGGHAANSPTLKG